MKPETARQMQILVDAHAVMEVRQQTCAAADMRYFEITDDAQLMTVTIDARTGIFEYPKAIHLAEEIGRRGRKLGMKLRIVVDDPKRCFVRDLGGSVHLRTEELVASDTVNA